MPKRPGANPLPTDPKAAVVEVLIRRVRVMSLQQAARTWFIETANPTDAARRMTQSLQREGLVECATLLARPEVLPDEPLAAWQPGLPKPEFGPIAWKLKKRRQDQAAIATPCVAAASGRLPRPTDTTHDLHLTAVFLLMCKELPTRACSWVFEAELVRPGEKLPDAIVTDGKAKTVIECGGEYDRKRLEEDHEFFASKGYGYEIW